jgi:hypothetical protein
MPVSSPHLPELCFCLFQTIIALEVRKSFAKPKRIAQFMQQLYSGATWPSIISLVPPVEKGHELRNPLSWQATTLRVRTCVEFVTVEEKMAGS